MKIEMHNTTDNNQRGNAMIYVLIALALFGFLTVTLSRQNNQADGQDLSDEQADLYANELIEYASAAQYAVELMLSSGSDINDLSFVNPTSGGFDTGSHIHKVFHPQGGGLNYIDEFPEGIAGPDSVSVIKRWRILQTTNVEWTPTTANDVIFTGYNIQQNICSIINEKITGSPTIPQLQDSIANTLINGSVLLDSTNCAQCDGYPFLCVENSAGLAYAFYNIIAAQ